MSFSLDGFTRGFDGPGTPDGLRSAIPAGVDVPNAHDWQERCDGDTCIYISTVSGNPRDVPAKLLLRLSEDKPAMLVASVPNGMRLSSGMIFRYGNDQANRINYIVCDSAFCTAQVQLK